MNHFCTTAGGSLETHLSCRSQVQYSRRLSALAGTGMDGALGAAPQSPTAISAPFEAPIGSAAARLGVPDLGIVDLAAVCGFPMGLQGGSIA